MIEISSGKFPSFPDSNAARGNRAAVILAGGDGSRLMALTRLVTGDERPKQFCRLIGGETLLGKTRSRVAGSVAIENTYFSLTKKHRRFIDEELADVSRSKMVIQPENKGTAPAILYSLLRVAMDSPDATVAFFPSDHFFSDEQAVVNSVELAFRAVEREPSAVVLLGIEADTPETSYGWIEPEESLFGLLPGSVSRVSQFWEKPSAGTAAKLMAKGGLWNSFVMVGKVDSFLRMFREHQPKMTRMFEAARTQLGRVTEAAVIRAIYSWIRDTNFSTEILELSAASLRVLRVKNAGWTDLGEPARVIGTLNTLGMQANWMPAVAA